MILLDNVQILAAVQRSLETHILPELKDEFARVQVAAALKALQEVCDRLEHGDPCAQLNAELIQGARQIAEDHETTSPEFVTSLVSRLSSVDREAPARELNRQLGRSLWELVSQNRDPAARELLSLLHSLAFKSYGGDTQYISGEAIASLT